MDKLQQNKTPVNKKNPLAVASEGGKGDTGNMESQK